MLVARESTQKRPRLRFALLSYVPIYLMCALSAGLLWRHPGFLFTIYLVTAAMLLYRWHTRADLFYFFVPFLLGPLGEIFAVGLGAWQYSKAALGVPLWLPLAWGIAMLFMKKTADALLNPQERVAST